MEEKYVALMVQKIKLSKNLYFLKFNGIIKDASMTNDKSLVDANNDKYLSFDDPKFYSAKLNDFAYMFQMTNNCVMDVYCKESLSEAIKRYMNFFNSNVYFTILDNNQKVKIVQIKKSSLTSSDKNSIDTSIIEAVNTTGDVKLTLSEKMLDDMISKLDHQDLEYLSILFKGLKQICNNARNNSNAHSDNSRTTLTSSNKTTNQIEPQPKLDILKTYKKMTEEIVGQDNIIKKLLMTIDKNTYANSFADSSEDRYHILIVGPSGSGKTRMMRCLQRYLNWPLVRIDTTQITMNGYHGGTIEDNILKPLLAQAKGNKELAQSGIVNLDEIDKKGSKGNQDVAGRGVLNAFLPFLDGTTYEVTYNSQHYTFDTSNLTVLASGAFTDILEEIDKPAMGFGSTMNPDKTISKEILEKRGDIPIEFLGRFPNLAQMRQLIDKDLTEILVKPKTSPLTFRHNYLLDCYNVDLKWSDDYIAAIVEEALKLKTGGRALKEIIEKSLCIAEWEIIESGDLRQRKELIVSAKTVEEPKEYVLKKGGI